MRRALFTGLVIMAAVVVAALAFGPRAAAEATRLLTAEEMRPFFIQALEQYAPWDPKEMEVQEVALYPSEVEVPAGRLSVEAEPSRGSRFLGRVTFLMTISVDGEPVKRVRMSGKVEVFKEVFCLATSLRRGHVLTPADLVTVRRPISSIRGRPIFSMKKAVGMALRRSAGAGQVVTEGLLRPPIVVRRGDRVTIVARSPWIEVKVPGEARQNGAKGDAIRVKNLMSKREITAQVVDHSTVVVRF